MRELCTIKLILKSNAFHTQYEYSCNDTLSESLRLLDKDATNSNKKNADEQNQTSCSRENRFQCTTHASHRRFFLYSY